MGGRLDQTYSMHSKKSFNGLGTTWTGLFQIVNSPFLLFFLNLEGDKIDTEIIT